MDQQKAGRVVLTGAAGRLGTILRPRLAPYCTELVSSDIVEICNPLDNEQFCRCDLSDLQATTELLHGAGAVVHFGGISNQRPFEELLQSNFIAVRNMFEACRRNGVRRVIYASSNHAVGFYPTSALLDPHVAYRPDSFYGVSKAFGELTGRLFYDRYGIEVVCLRIGSCIERPKKPRHLATWISFGDLGRLVRASLEAENIGYEVLYGVSNNSRSWWTNEKGRIRFTPLDSADTYVDTVEGLDDETSKFQGGAACSREIPDGD